MESQRKEKQHERKRYNWEVGKKVQRKNTSQVNRDNIKKNPKAKQNKKVS